LSCDRLQRVSEHGLFPIVIVHRMAKREQGSPCSRPP